MISITMLSITDYLIDFVERGYSPSLYEEAGNWICCICKLNDSTVCMSVKVHDPLTAVKRLHQKMLKRDEPQLEREDS